MLLGLVFLVGGLWLVVPSWVVERRKHKGLKLFETDPGIYPWSTTFAQIAVLLSVVLILWGAVLWVVG